MRRGLTPNPRLQLCSVASHLPLLENLPPQFIGKDHSWWWDLGSYNQKLTLCWHLEGIFNNLEYRLNFLCINARCSTVINDKVISCGETGRSGPEPVLGGEGNWSSGREKGDCSSLSPEPAGLTKHHSGLSSSFRLRQSPLNQISVSPAPCQ